MYSLTVASVLLVWCLGTMVALIAWVSAAHRGDALAAQVSRACRRAASLEVWSRMQAPTRVIRTPAEALAWRRERDSYAPTVQTRAPVAAASADTHAAWAQHSLGLRVPSEVASTVVDARPAEAEAALAQPVVVGGGDVGPQYPLQVVECEYAAQEGTVTVYACSACTAAWTGHADTCPICVSPYVAPVPVPEIPPGGFAAAGAKCAISHESGSPSKSTVRINGILETMPEAVLRTVYASQVNAPRVQDWSAHRALSLRLDYCGWHANTASA